MVFGWVCVRCSDLLLLCCIHKRIAMILIRMKGVQVVRWEIVRGRALCWSGEGGP